MTIIKIDTRDIEKYARELDQVRKKQLPFAIRLTVNKLAENAKRHMDIQEIPSLDRPTRYALNMMRVEYAKRGDLTSAVKVKDRAMVTKRGMVGPDQVLGHLFTGGQRRGKGFEGLMQRAGILPKGMYVVPGRGVTLDEHGNIPRGLIIQLLAYFRAFQESGFRANMTDKSRAAFERRRTKKQFKGASSTKFFLVRVGEKSKLNPGIWERTTYIVPGAAGKEKKVTKVNSILMFVDRAVYKQHFDLPAIVDMIIKRDSEFEFSKALEHAVATAK